MNNIINPINNQKLSIFSYEGKELLKQYILSYNNLMKTGGMSGDEEDDDDLVQPEDEGNAGDGDDSGDGSDDDLPGDDNMDDAVDEDRERKDEGRETIETDTENDKE